MINLATKAKEIMAAKKHITRADLARELGVYRGKLDTMEKAGLIVLPPKLTTSQAATLGRKKNKVMQGYYINKPASWQV